MTQLKFLFWGGGEMVVNSKIGMATLMTMMVVMTMNHVCVDFQRKLLLREIHHAIIPSIITDTIIPLPLERH